MCTHTHIHAHTHTHTHIHTHTHTVKVWDSSWGLCCSLVGHQAAVTSLAPYPYGPMILSGSLDCSLCVWNLNTQDEVER